MENLKKFGFGTMRLPLTNAEDPKSIDYDQVKEMVDEYLAQGFTYFDTAFPYHEETSEIAVRECLVKRHDRNSFQLADKMPMYKVNTPEDLHTIFNLQLEKCGVEYFDYYLLHNLGVDRYEKTKKVGGFEFIKELKAKGLAKNIGFSFHDTADVLDMILTENPDVDFVQLQINYLDWDSQVVQSGDCYEVAKKHGKPVIVMEPVKGGVLASLPEKATALLKEGSAPSYAIRFAASLDNVFMVLSGMSNKAQLTENLSFMKDFKPLSQDEKDMLQKCAAIINEAIAVPCTSCKYCMEVCPISVNIPSYFALLNLFKTLDKKTNMYYERAKFNHATASECLKCGKCETNCPQHIAIRENLEKFAEIYEAQ